MVLAQLLDFSVPLDVALLDRVVETFHNGSPENVRQPESSSSSSQLSQRMPRTIIVINPLCGLSEARASYAHVRV